MADEQFGVNPSKKISFNDGYTREALMQSSAAAKEEDAARDRAMQSLRDAFYNSQEVTQDQGIAAALLAAIPTFGGYLIGKSVGSTEVPAGMTNIDPSKLKQTGAYAGGLAGAGIGQQAAGGYLTSVLDENKSENKVYEQIFNTEMDRAKSLEQKSNLYEARADQFEANKAMMPLELEQYAAQQDIQANKQIEVNNALQMSKEAREALPSDVLQKLSAYEAEMAAGVETPSVALTANDLAGLAPAQQKVVIDRLAESRRLNSSLRNLSQEKAVSIPATLMPKIAAAENIRPAQERLRQLYNDAIKEIGPGFVQAFARKGISALPANKQQLFTSTLKSVAMQMNKAVDPTPSDAGMLAQLEKLQGAVDSGDFLNAMDFEVKNARRLALAEIEPFASGDYPNAQAVSLLNLYKNKWGLVSQKEKKLSEIDAKIAAIEAQLGGN